MASCPTSQQLSAYHDGELDEALRLEIHRHLPACPASVLGNAWGVWTYQTRKHDKKLVANLKPEQALKNGGTN